MLGPAPGCAAYKLFLLGVAFSSAACLHVKPDRRLEADWKSPDDSSSGPAGKLETHLVFLHQMFYALGTIGKPEELSHALQAEVMGRLRLQTKQI